MRSRLDAERQRASSRYTAALKQNDGPPGERDVAVRALTRETLAELLSKTGDRDGAIGAAREALHLQPDQHHSRWILANCLLEQGKNAEALEALAMAAKVDPRFEMTYVYLGGVHQNMGDLPTAIRDFEHALAINPRN